MPNDTGHNGLVPGVIAPHVGKHTFVATFESNNC